MKTSIIQLSIVAVLLLSSFVIGGLDYQNKEKDSSIETSDLQAQNTSMEPILIEAVYVNGELIPVVTLPELTIEAEMKPVQYVHAHLVNGTVLPYVTLPELTIEASI